ncbi:MAG: hypothetical protein ACTSYR_04105 [Candidatus Odinarchaeia archaeon]
MKLTLIKTQHYDLKSYGFFTIKFRTRQGHLPNIIPFDELHVNHNTAMPLTDEQDKAVIKEMKKYKTDIFVDDYGTFFTRAGSGFTEVSHKKLAMYGYDEPFKHAVDSKYEKYIRD